MVILDDRDNSINEADIYLTLEEAEDFIGLLQSVLEMDPTDFHTGNVFGAADGFNITPGYMEFSIYTPENLKEFPETFAKLINEEDEIH